MSVEGQVIKGISQVVGTGKLIFGEEPVQIYRASRQLLCSACINPINEGELFTRRKLQGVSLTPRCRKCSPFELAEEKSKGQELLDHLLAPRIITQPGKTEEQRVRTEVEKRIGPALAQSKHKR